MADIGKKAILKIVEFFEGLQQEAFQVTVYIYSIRIRARGIGAATG